MAFIDPAIILKLIVERLDTLTATLSTRYFGERHGSMEDGGVAPIVARVAGMKWQRSGSGGGERQMAPASGVGGGDVPDLAEFTVEVRVLVNEDQGQLSVYSAAAFIAQVEYAFRETFEDDASTTHHVHFYNTEADLETVFKGGITGGTVTISGRARRTSGVTIFDPP